MFYLHGFLHPDNLLWLLKNKEICCISVSVLDLVAVPKGPVHKDLEPAAFVST
jgi:hypothetical protein